jgi:hypothetical protein
MATANKKNRRSESRKRTFSFDLLIAICCLLAFGVMAGLLFQHSVITEKNTEILNLQKTLDEAVQVNDSKEGQLVTNMDLQAIEAEARGYGMTEPTQAQYRKETVAKQEPTTTQTNTEKVKSWLEKLF